MGKIRLRSQENFKTVGVDPDAKVETLLSLMS